MAAAAAAVFCFAEHVRRGKATHKNACMLWLGGFWIFRNAWALLGTVKWWEAVSSLFSTAAAAAASRHSGQSRRRNESKQGEKQIAWL